MFSISLGINLALLATAALANGFPTNSIYSNPILPGWHSDPSCVFVPQEDNIFFCTTSTFSAFPGLPIYASKDLLNWKLVSNVFNRPDQIPDLANVTGQQDGISAATIRYREGTFYVTVSFIAATTIGLKNLIFTTTNPYSDAAWSTPIPYYAIGYDPDLFWDDDGQAYITLSNYQPAGIAQFPIDVKTGKTGSIYSVWNGTGGASPEGPHMYKKDGYYYLMIAEGGTELGHMETIARSSSLKGPYESYTHNPILTNRNTSEYFQTVGHADLFHDAADNWWGVALCTRSGPAWQNYPMGQETCLYPVTWQRGQWPVLHPIRGEMDGWRLPATNKHISGNGPFLEGSDEYTFPPRSSIPAHFVYWRFPKPQPYTIFPPGHPNTLRLLPSKSNLTANPLFNPDDGFTLLMRRQTDTLFTFNIDIEFDPTKEEEEAGLTVFLTQDQYFDLGLVLLRAGGAHSPLSLHLRYRTTCIGYPNATIPATRILSVPRNWSGKQIRLQVQAVDETQYKFSAGLSSQPSRLETIGHGPATVVSGGTGPFTGALVGAYATNNGGSGTSPSYIHR
ncbi:xylosidase : arabinofuranosidase [Xylogone sp. PMI_703]|nr:xylosidase : arabinofuranosidase [Xylogone sp. PMI_703]